MGNPVTIFTNEEFGNVRTTVINGEPYFCGKDVATALGYANTRDALKKHVDDEDKQLIQRSQIATLEIQNRGMTFINESGMYSLVLGSKLTSAKKFKRWITSEVIPQIRKTGGYIPVKEEDDDSVIMARALLIAQKTIEEKDKQLKESNNDNMVLKCENAKLKPKADYADKILLSSGTVTTTQIAKDYGMSAKMFNDLLHSLGIQYKVNGQWLLYSEYADKCYTKSCTHVINHTYGEPESKVYTRWTQKGRLFLYESLKNKGIYPNIEKAEMNK